MENNQGDYEVMEQLKYRDPKAYAEFKRTPFYGPYFCYRFPDVECNGKCKLWKVCSKKGGNIHA